MVALAEHFGRDERSRHSEWLRQRKWFIRAKRDQQRKEEVADKLEEAALGLATTAVMATEIQIEQFEARLDAYDDRLDEYDATLNAYDEAIMRALMVHTERLEILQTQHAELLANAYVLKNGVRVFKSKDGSFATNKLGEKLDTSIVHPDDIPAGYTPADDLIDSLEAMQAEEAIIKDIHDVQHQVDKGKEFSASKRDIIGDIRTKIDQGELTTQDIEDAPTDLDNFEVPKLPTLPLSVVKHLATTNNPDNAPNLKSSFATSTNAPQHHPTATLSTAPKPEFDG